MINITLPVFIFGSMVSLLIGAIVHLIGGGKLIRLVFSMLFAWIGFWIGNYLSTQYGINLFVFGQVDYGAAIITSLFMALFGYWLAGENRKEDS